METVLLILLAVLITGLRTWITYKNPVPGRSQKISDDLFDFALKVGKEKREGKDISGKEIAYDEASKMMEEDMYDIAGEDPFDVAMKISKEKRDGKDTLDEEKYYEFKKNIVGLMKAFANGLINCNIFYECCLV